jgi:hypothetical protein
MKTFKNYFFIILLLCFTSYAFAEDNLNQIKTILENALPIDAYRFESEEFEILNEKGNLEKRKFEVTVYHYNTEEEKKAVINTVKGYLHEHLKNNSQNSAKFYIVTNNDTQNDNNRTPQSLEDEARATNQDDEELKKIANEITENKIETRFIYTGFKNPTLKKLDETFVRNQKGILVSIRWFLNSSAVAWTTHITHLNLPLTSAIYTGIEVGALSAGLMLINPQLQKFLVTSYYLKHVLKISREEYLNHLKTYNTLLEKKKLKLELSSHEKKFLKKMKLLNIVSKTEEFAKWYALEVSFVMALNFSLYVHGFSPDLLQHLPTVLMSTMVTATMTTIAQAPWDLAIAKGTEKQLMHAEHTISDLKVLEQTRKRIFAYSGLKVLAISALSVAGAAADQLGIPIAKAGLIALAVIGWYEYLKFDYGKVMQNFKNHCIKSLKKLISQLTIDPNLKNTFHLYPTFKA